MPQAYTQQTYTELEKQELNELLRSAIQRVAVGPNRGKDLARDECQRLMGGILDDLFDPVQVAVLLIGLRMKHESSDELAGLFDAMQSRVQAVTVPVDTLLCLADPFDGYTRHLPMSPFLPCVLASCGLPALIHGVESVGPKHGITAGKVYRAAGMRLNKSQSECSDKIRDFGWSYLEQDVYLPRLAKVHDLRDRIVKRTAITTLERVLIPLSAQGQTWFALGYVHKAYPEIYGAIAAQAGFDKYLLLKGVEGGLTAGVNKPQRYHFADDTSRAPIKSVFEPYLPDSPDQAMPNTDAINSAVQACLDLGLSVLDGEKNVARDSLVLNAANLLSQFELCESFAQALEKAEECLDNGAAKQCFLNAI